MGLDCAQEDELAESEHGRGGEKAHPGKQVPESQPRLALVPASALSFPLGMTCFLSLDLSCLSSSQWDFLFLVQKRLD